VVRGFFGISLYSYLQSPSLEDTPFLFAFAASLVPVGTLISEGAIKSRGEIDQLLALLN
jgi:hypothetical protein